GKFSGEVARALTVSKLSNAGSSNNQKYQLMGDAALKLNLPQLWSDLRVQDATGADTTAIEQGHKMHFTGRVLDGLGGPPVPLEGRADVLVEHAPPTLQAPPCVLSTCDRPFYRYRAGTIYRGQVSIHGGTFAGDFIVPIEARPGRPSRIRAYISNSGTDGTGDLPLRVATGTSAIDDQAGPEIRLSFANGATRVRPDAALRIDLTD